jgi:hypothetical protein
MCSRGSKTENLLEKLYGIAYLERRNVVEKPIVRETKERRI